MTLLSWIPKALRRAILPGQGGPRASLLRLSFLGVLVALAAASCAEGTYPLDFFYEMHYQPSYGPQEPPRLYPPAGSVPITGREVLPTAETFNTLVNPIPDQGLAAGAQLFAINCSMCHGISGRGDGHVLKTMMEKYGYTPKLDPNLTLAKGLPDGFLFGIISNRDLVIFGDDKVMPPFEKLLTAEERWMLINYIRTLPSP